MAKNQLRKLSQSLPAPEEVKAIMAALREEKDHSVAIVASSILDSALEDLLKSKVRTNDKEVVAHAKLTTETFASRVDNEIGASALAQYVAHRRITLDFLERAIERQEGADKFPLESVVHQLVYPMKTTSDDLPYTEQNLWMIDERLTYHSFIASDPTLSTLERVEVGEAKRPDVFIFNQQIVYGEGDSTGTESPVTSLTLVEFKRPQRNNYSAADNPIKQCFDLVRLIRSGKFKNVKARPINTANDKIPAYCYIVADITPTLKDILEGFDAYPTPDNQGYYGFQKNYGIYYEVAGYDKLLRDARKRNRIFFDKLNTLARHK